MLTLGLALLLATASVDDGAACAPYTSKGSAFATCFDPGTGLLLEAGPRWSGGEGALSVRAGILVRTDRTSHSKGTPWLNAHRLLLTEAWTGERRGLTFTAYDGLLRRHLEEGFILLPTARPVRIPFPFDVTLALRGGHVERRVWEGPGWTLETGRVGLLLDPVRAATPRRWLGVGPAASHALRHTRDGTEHELSPFTSLMLDAGWETEDGLWALRASGLAGWSHDLEGGARFRARADGGVERVLVAVNDVPVALRVSGSYVRGDAGLARRDEWTVGTGLLVRPFSARWR